MCEPPCSVLQNRSPNISLCTRNTGCSVVVMEQLHGDVINWNHFPRYWPSVRGIHRSPVNSIHKDQWHGALMFSSICTWINSWVKKIKMRDKIRYTLFSVGYIQQKTLASLKLLSDNDKNMHNTDSGDFRHHRAHYGVTAMLYVVPMLYTEYTCLIYIYIYIYIYSCCENTNMCVPTSHMMIITELSHHSQPHQGT